MIAVVLYHGPKPWSAPTCLTEAIDAPPDAIAAAGDLLPSFRFVLDDLCRIDEADLRAREAAVFGRVALLLLKFARSVSAQPSTPGQLTLEQLAEKVTGLLALLGPQDTTMSIRYIINVVPDVDPHHLVEAFKNAAPSVKETAMTLAERLRQEGRKEGVRDSLLSLLRLKFGSLAPGIETRIEAADAGTLQAWFDAAVTAERIEDVLGGATP